MLFDHWFNWFAKVSQEKDYCSCIRHVKREVFFSMEHPHGLSGWEVVAMKILLAQIEMVSQRLVYAGVASYGKQSLPI
jgi:hypothetical protein